MKQILMIILALVLVGCGAKQQKIIDVHNKIVAAETTYSGEVQTALKGDNLPATIQAVKRYLDVVQNSNKEGLPEDYIQAIELLEKSLNEMISFLESVNDSAKVDWQKLEALDSGRLYATKELNAAAQNNGLEMLGP
tara:strand:+ start:245 stop:655 length:411 start_codon:yes stop_codon:yes gene_type:complete